MTEQASPLPHGLVDCGGPLDPEQIEAAMASLGPHGLGSAALAAEGFVPPDVLCGQTLFLLSRQPRSRADDEAGRASPIAGGVWVREQVTIHRPVRREEAFVVSGVSARRFVRKGRRYGVTTALTTSRDGTLLVSNCTTGLLEYQADSSRPDSEEGLAEAAVAVPSADRTAASQNPARDSLRSVVPAALLGGQPLTLELAWMLTRDGKRPMNPIHSDPEIARQAGLRAPIAGGSHVAAFALDPIMQAWGPHCLLYGAHLDLRWFAPTYGGDTIVPRAVVESTAGGAVLVSIAIDSGDGERRLRGTVSIPVEA